MIKNRPVKKEEIEKEKALHEALELWLGSMNMEKLNDFHEKEFGHSFDPSFDDMPEEPRQSNYTALGNDER